MDADALNSRRSQIVPALVVALAAGVFWRTAYPTITWWDSSSYSLAAATLGVNSPPGSLLLTLIGWPVARLSFGVSPAHALNLFAGLLAAVTSALVYVVALASLRIAGFAGRGNTATALGAAAGALTFAFSGTLWTYATQFTPYVLTAVFTGLILWTMLRWWSDADRPDAWAWLALLGLLFGLDFSVHRTNALLIPGAVVWILLRRPTTLRSPTAIFAGAGATRRGARRAAAPHSTRRVHQFDPQLLRSEQPLAILGLRDDQAARRLVPARAVSAQVADLVGADDGRAARARPRFSEPRGTRRSVGALAGRSPRRGASSRSGEATGGSPRP